MDQLLSTKPSKAAKRRAEIVRVGKEAYYDGKKQRRELQQQQEQTKADAAKRLTDAYETAPRDKIIKAHINGADRFGKYNILPDRLRSGTSHDPADTATNESSKSPRPSRAAKRRAAIAAMGEEAYYQQKREKRKQQQEQQQAKVEGVEAKETEKEDVAVEAAAGAVSLVLRGRSEE